jgi:hypothetical protein
MRFMMLMIPKVYQGKAGQNVSSDFAPSADDVARMNTYNEELARAGALIALDGLHPATTGARISFAGGKPRVTDGPFTEAKEVLGGYWIINVKSREEAIAWAKKVPAADGDVIEVRQIFEMEEFPEEVQRAGDSALVREEIKKHAKA